MLMIKHLTKQSIEWYFNRKTASHWTILLIDSIVVVVTGVITRLLLDSSKETIVDLPHILLTWIAFLFAYLIGFRIMRTYSGIIRYSSFVDLSKVAIANIIAIFIIFCVRFIPKFSTIFIGITWEEVVISFIITTTVMWLIRMLVKNLYDYHSLSSTAQKVFIYGVKDDAMAIAKSIQSQPSQYVISGFVTDDVKDCNHMLLGSKIYLNDKILVSTMLQNRVTVFMVSPSKADNLRDKQDMVEALTNANVKILTYKQQEWDGNTKISHTQLKEVDIEELLPRNQIEIDLQTVASILSDKCVMITGAAGSIGSEIVRQVSSFKPKQLVLVDQAETPLHDIRLMMKRYYPNVPCVTVTASILTKKHMESIFNLYKPEYVFHAAAYKHVPMMEDNPGEAVVNNIEGTRIIADLSVKNGVKKFVMISTDKAVNPTNVMGCSKRICEMYCQSLNKAIAEGKVEGHTQFVTTRFGNVLGSNGSVIPLFKEQIKNGGPVTVTHPEIIRYFMLIPEACKLVLQAGSMGNGGEIFVFDMGQPVRIADLAKRMISLSGAKDIEIKYTGLRDGEKLYEELLNKEENTKESSHPKIKLASVREFDYFEVCDKIDKLIDITDNLGNMEIVKQMKVLVPEFKSKNSIYEALDA